MGLFLRLVIGIPVMCIGILLLVKSYKIVQKIGYNDWAEQHMGDGGTYTLVKIIGMLLIFLSMLGILGVIPLPF
ncbi:MAG: hypothetical protein AAB632_00835 [Patescibacteria group bacterium]